MSVFANENDLHGMRLAPDTYTEGASGFAALGKPVPFYRRAAGYDHMKAMGVSDSDARFSCIEAMCDRIKRDDPHGAMQEAHKHLDVTGVYRLLAVLLTAEEHSPTKGT